ncbi:transcriptional activator hac1 [Anaeramoeba flamelloides]|uniref:Transcriptional activator hac1 n=1 Tax=Anaeramoeba flamelloides TaxID=1746091 RepID=A0AAV7Z328_9EUKA|nr:transcriptional activator hac1 [Anaeramoeba flamelloides]
MLKNKEPFDYLPDFSFSFSEMDSPNNINWDSHSDPFERNSEQLLDFEIYHEDNSSFWKDIEELVLELSSDEDSNRKSIWKKKRKRKRERENIEEKEEEKEDEKENENENEKEKEEEKDKEGKKKEDREHCEIKRRANNKFVNARFKELNDLLIIDHSNFDDKEDQENDLLIVDSLSPRPKMEIKNSEDNNSLKPEDELNFLIRSNKKKNKKNKKKQKKINKKKKKEMRKKILERNRINAKRSREKKKLYISNLESENKEFKKKIDKLLDVVYKLNVENENYSNEIFKYKKLLESNNINYFDHYFLD